MNISLYLERHSWMHRIDPRVKIFSVFGMVFIALVEDELLPLLFLVGILLLVGMSAGIGRNLIRFAPVLMIIIIMSSLMWGIATREDLIYGTISSTGLLFGFLTGIKLLIMILSGIIWISTTRTEEMVIGMEKLGFPRAIAFSFSTAVRMLPLVLQNAHTISQAQQSRGLDLRSGSIRERIKKQIMIIIPAIVSMIRNTHHFAMALESRGYDPESSRSSFLTTRIRAGDIAFLIASILVVIGALLINTAPFSTDIRVFLTLTILFLIFIGMARLSVLGRNSRYLWGNTRMVVLTAFSAALYAAVVIPFKGVVLIPGVVDLRPANALVPVLGLLFGPAGAWGVGLGVVISDLFGTFGPGTFFGFFGNLAMAWIMYHLWKRTWLIQRDDPAPCQINSVRKTLNFFLLAVLGASACALIIAWGFQLLGLLPFALLSPVILVNNLLPIFLLSLPLYLILFPRIKAWGLYWADIVGPEGTRANEGRTGAGILIVLSGILLGFAGGILGNHFMPGYGLLLATTGIVVMVIGSRL